MRKESETPELKKSLAQLREGIISLSTMLNKHKRGKVYFGINDEGKVCRQTVGERTIADITQTIRNHLKPLPPVLFKNGFIEAFGTGFDRAFSLCEKENVRYYYDNNDFGFTFCFMRKQNFLTSKVNEDVGNIYQAITPIEREILRAIRNNIYITVSALFRADQSMPGVQGNDNYINTETWAHYAYEDMSVNHAICIVGYDDNYPAENFMHILYKKNEYGIEIWDEDGNPIIDEEKTKATVPPGSGAWIVKNSWGSETDWFTNENGRPVNKDKWGLLNEEGEHTGYFYISYYDKTLKAPQTYQFGKDLNVEELTLLQYDYLSSFDGLLEDRDETLLKTANIFETDEDEKLVSVGIRTTGRNNLADIFVYLLNDQSSHPEDGTLLSAFSAQPEYAGYHRVNLPESVHLEKGSKFSIVTTIREISEDGTLIYKYSVNMASNLEESQELGFPIYGKAVVNAGESFLYKNGSWSDWTEYRTTDEFKELYSENEHVYGEIDNFTIKAYLLPDETVEPDTVPAVNTEIPVSQTETYAAQTVQTGVHNETGLWIIILFGSIICIYRLRKEA